MDSDMSCQPGSSRFQALFEFALQEYEKQTGIPLAKHPLAEQLQNCQSVESVMALLQDKARAFSKFRGSGKITKSLKSVVSAIAALGQDIGMVCPWLTDRGFHVSEGYSIVVPPCECNIYWPWYPTRCMCLFCFYMRIFVT
jgi:hypothetical protein